MKTTLKKIRKHSPCAHGWKKLLNHLGKTEADDEPLSLITILDSNGLNDAFWCLRAVDEHERQMRLYAVGCARQAQHLMTDPRSVKALDVAERFANGEATEDELSFARDAARDAASTAVGDVASAASAAAWTAWAAWDAASFAASTAAGAAGDAVGDAVGDLQTAKFREMFGE